MCYFWLKKLHLDHVQFFVKITLGSNVIFGKTTFESFVIFGIYLMKILDVHFENYTETINIMKTTTFSKI